jgi:hypothetical protein
MSWPFPKPIRIMISTNRVIANRLKGRNNVTVKGQFTLIDLFVSIAASILVTVLLPSASQAADGSPSDKLSQLEKFKEFISSPPVISNLVYETNPLLLSLTPSKGTWVQARWQTNGIFWRRFQKSSEIPDEGKSVSMAVSRFNNEYWGYSDLGGSRYYTAPMSAAGRTSFEERQVPENRYNEAVMMCNSMEDELSSVLNMGIPNLEIGSIRWKSNSFSAISRLARTKINGTIQLSSNGVPEGIRLVIERGGTNYNYLVEYQYQSPLSLPFIPNIIALSFVSGERKKAPEIRRIHELTVGSTSSPKSAFDYKHLVVSNPAKGIFTNGMSYVVTPKGLVEISR